LEQIRNLDKIARNLDLSKVHVCNDKLFFGETASSEQATGDHTDAAISILADHPANLSFKKWQCFTLSYTTW
jgi:hypothetical protein